MLHPVAEVVHPDRVVVAQHGENCWEHYPGGGVRVPARPVRALHATPRRPAGDDRRLTWSEHPPRDTLPHLFAGSWINHNFAIWIGHEEDNTAWDALHRTREHLRSRASRPARPAGQAPARPGRRSTSPRAATGSGGTATITPAPRTRCSTTCSASTCRTSTCCWATRRRRSWPGRSAAAASEPMHTLPRSFLDVQDRRPATRSSSGSAPAATPARTSAARWRMVTQGPLKDVYFGFDLERAAGARRLRRPGPRRPWPTSTRCASASSEPAGCEVRVDRPGPAEPGGRDCCDQRRAVERRPSRRGRPSTRSSRWRSRSTLLGVKVGRAGAVFRRAAARAARAATGRRARAIIQLTRPSPDFEQIMWDV